MDKTILLLITKNYCIIHIGEVMYQSLYRKYRPDSFEKVIGQDHITKTLVNQIKSGNIAHAYLLTGTRGTGKTSVARIFARAINCLSPKDGSPCGECDCCKKLLAGTSLDVVEIDAASNNSVDDARAIRDNVRYAPVDCKYKVYIIDEVHQLSGAAFNALLKTLEEPPAHAVFILATTEVQKIPATIMSRCLRLDFHLVPQDTLEKHVASIFEKEGVKYTKEGVSAIAAAGEGSVRDTLSVADMCVSYSDVVDYDSVLGVLGANDPAVIAKIALATLSGDVKEAIDSVESASSLGKSVQLLTKDLTRYFRDLIIIRNDPAANNILKLPDKLYNAASEIAKSFDSAVIMRALDIFSTVEAKSRLSNQPKILLETAIIKTATLSGEDLSDLLAKVNALEAKVKELESMPQGRPDYGALKKMLTPEEKATPAKPVMEATPIAAMSTDTVPFEVSDAQAVESLPFDSAPAPEPETSRIEKNANVEDYLSKEVREQMAKLRGRILNRLRVSNLKMLYIALTNDKDTLIKLQDGRIILAFKNEMNYNYCNSPAMIEEIKKVFSEEIGEPIEVSVKYYNDDASGALSTAEIIKLFSGAESLNIKRR